MNKGILLGVLTFALGATYISYLAAEKTAKYEHTAKIKTTTPSSDRDWTEIKLLTRIKDAAKSTPRTPIRDEKDVREIFTPPARDKSSSRAPEVTREKLEKESHEAIKISQPQDKADHIRTATEMTATTIDAPKEKATREKREASSEERTKTERIAEEKKATFSDDSKALVVRKPGDIVAVTSDTLVDTKAAKPLDSVTGALVPYTGAGAIVPAAKPLDSVTGAIVPYTGAGAIVPAAKPLDSVTGAIVPYKGKSSELATTSSDEKKSGMSGKQKAAVGAGVVGAGVVGAGVVGAGLIGAGLIGAGLIGVGLGGDKDKPAEGIAPEKVEDIKGLDVGSGSSASFEPSPITD